MIVLETFGSEWHLKPRSSLIQFFDHHWHMSPVFQVWNFTKFVLECIVTSLVTQSHDVLYVTMSFFCSACLGIIMLQPWDNTLLTVHDDSTISLLAARKFCQVSSWRATRWSTRWENRCQLVLFLFYCYRSNIIAIWFAVSLTQLPISQFERDESPRVDEIYSVRT